MVKRVEYEAWGNHKEINKKVSWGALPPSIQNYISENMLENDEVSIQMKAAFKRTFGLSIIQLEVGEDVFDLEETIAQFDGDMSSADFVEDINLCEQPRHEVSNDIKDDIPKYTKEYMERNDLILKQRFLL